MSDPVRSGLLVVDKPGGMTSHDVVAHVRRAMGTRKVGHAGTLDPMATGVLVIGVERATRLLGLLAMRDKSYGATIRLGSTTVTDDAEGDVTAAAAPAEVTAVTDEQIAVAMRALTGTIEQRPSAVSAIKVDGRRAYERVRAGEDVELAARTVTISRFDVVAVRRDEPSAIDIDVTVDCTTGTYVRALARDLGAALGVGGHLTRLRRTRVGPFVESEAIALADVTGDTQRQRLLVPLGSAAGRCFTTVVLGESAAEHVRHGRPIDWPDAAAATDEAPLALLDEGDNLLALATAVDGRARYVAVFAG